MYHSVMSVVSIAIFLDVSASEVSSWTLTKLKAIVCLFAVVQPSLFKAFG